jgi:hypothetical protein
MAGGRQAMDTEPDLGLHTEMVLEDLVGLGADPVFDLSLADARGAI